MFRDELQKKDALIQQLVRYKPLLSIFVFERMSYNFRGKVHHVVFKIC